MFEEENHRRGIFYNGKCNNNVSPGRIQNCACHSEQRDTSSASEPKALRGVLVYFQLVINPDCLLTLDKPFKLLNSSPFVCQSTQPTMAAGGTLEHQKLWYTSWRPVEMCGDGGKGP